MRQLLAFLPFLLPVLVGCATSPAPPEAVLDGSAVEDFARVRPARVVVRPVEEAAEVRAPLTVLRGEFYKGLMERRYAPFRLDLDPSAVPEDPGAGTLVVRIRAWDRSRTTSDGIVLASGEAWLARGDRTVWQARFENLRLRCRRADGNPADATERDELAAAMLAPTVLRTLPIKGD